MSEPLKMDEREVEKLADAHWKYVESTLRVHDELEELIVVCAHHYKTAFAHGYKHGFEDAKS